MNGTKDEKKDKRKGFKAKPEQIEKARQLYEQGGSLVGIEKAVGISDDTLAKMRDRFGWKRKDDDSQYLGQIREKYESSNISLEKIGLEFGITAHRVAYLAGKERWNRANRRKRANRIDKKTLEDIKDDYEITKMSIKVIAEKYGIAEATVRHRAKEEGWVRVGYVPKIQWLEGTSKKHDDSKERIGAIKEKVIQNIGKQIKVKTDVTGWDKRKRNESEGEYIGTIEETFANVFTIKKQSGLHTSISYVDLFEKGKAGSRTEVVFLDD